MTKEQISESATDKVIGALLYQNSFLAEINKSGETAFTLRRLLELIGKASQQAEWEISDREKKLMKAFFSEPELKRDETIIES